MPLWILFILHAITTDPVVLHLQSAYLHFVGDSDVNAHMKKVPVPAVVLSCNG